MDRADALGALGNGRNHRMAVRRLVRQRRDPFAWNQPEDIFVGTQKRGNDALRCGKGRLDKDVQDTQNRDNPAMRRAHSVAVAGVTQL